MYNFLGESRCLGLRTCMGGFLFVQSLNTKTNCGCRTERAMFADGQGYNDIPVSHKALVRGEFIKNVIPAFGEKLLRVCYN